MKTLLSVFAFLFIGVSLATAGDYALVKTKVVMTAGVTNAVKVYPTPSGYGAELIEFHLVGSGIADTATVSRVSYCGCITNKLCIVTNPGTTSVALGSTNFTAATSAWNANDYYLISMTSTGNPTCYLVTRAHPGSEK